MNTAEFFKVVTSVVKKEVYGAVKVPVVESIFNDIAQISYMEYLIGCIKDYQPGRPIPPVHIEATQRINVALAPLRIARSPWR
jgi:hypothetical protein